MGYCLPALHGDHPVLRELVEGHVELALEGGAVRRGECEVRLGHDHVLDVTTELDRAVDLKFQVSGELDEVDLGNSLWVKCGGFDEREEVRLLLVGIAARDATKEHMCAVLERAERRAGTGAVLARDRAPRPDRKKMMRKKFFFLGVVGLFVLKF